MYAVSTSNEWQMDWTMAILHYSKKLKEHDQHHLWYVDTESDTTALSTELIGPMFKVDQSVDC